MHGLWSILKYILLINFNGYILQCNSKFYPHIDELIDIISFNNWNVFCLQN